MSPFTPNPFARATNDPDFSLEFRIVLPAQHSAIMAEVNSFHTWPSCGHGVKYVEARFDNRQGAYYSYEFSRGGDHVHITSTNRRGPDDELFVEINLYRDVMDWLLQGRSDKDLRKVRPDLLRRYACLEDGIDPSSPEPIFSETNRYAVALAEI